MTEPRSFRIAPPEPGTLGYALSRSRDLTDEEAADLYRLRQAQQIIDEWNAAQGR